MTQEHVDRKRLGLPPKPAPDPYVAPDFSKIEELLDKAKETGNEPQ